MDIAERNYHLKLQEMCDCYLETDFRKQMQGMLGTADADLEENAVKFLSLAIMYSLTEKARKLSLKKKDGEVTVIMKGDAKVSLPAPSPALFDKMSEIIRAILHIEEDKGELPLSLGLRSGDVELQIKVKRKPGQEKVKIKFPG
ncbi:MAG: hypothetical protein H8E41_03340 [Desulfobulbaceae bacterium]|uniref:Uncharacterized protein n=1 Tax=Candidatus Desulfobia pelagia TaxID=2841692 RepID=A0A8J6TEF9_9BACT|nr:hypothetical protein [Candidatus Desulfobia pelagia]